MRSKILIVDDAATVRLYYSGILSALGCLVEEAWNGAEGLEKALLAPPDLFLVDVNMPYLDGYGMLRAVRQEPVLSSIPAVMISTESVEQGAPKSQAVGANLYLHKPVRPERLTSIVRVLLGMPLT
ncbi:response regulator [Roseomonas sp. USHLN139]|uniref:response regulator n=1 Tax=Roseomonas sp. USHLN139 TaxID=3081298 RepID=UPI003B018A68